jgi:hypothetical protein
MDYTKYLREREGTRDLKKYKFSDIEKVASTNIIKSGKESIFKLMSELVYEKGIPLLQAKAFVSVYINEYLEDITRLMHRSSK